MWSFTRVPEHELVGPGDLEIRNIYNRRQCQDECLRAPRGPCRLKHYSNYDQIVNFWFKNVKSIQLPNRSVTYYGRERLCKLSSETRRTRPESFRKAGPDIDYMENECAPGKVNANLEICSYNKITNWFCHSSSTLWIHGLSRTISTCCRQIYSQSLQPRRLSQELWQRARISVSSLQLPRLQTRMSFKFRWYAFQRNCIDLKPRILLWRTRNLQQWWVLF